MRRKGRLKVTVFSSLGLCTWTENTHCLLSFLFCVCAYEQKMPMVPSVFSSLCLCIWTENTHGLLSHFKRASTWVYSKATFVFEFCVLKSPYLSVGSFISEIEHQWAMPSYKGEDCELIQGGDQFFLFPIEKELNEDLLKC